MVSKESDTPTMARNIIITIIIIIFIIIIIYLTSYEFATADLTMQNFL